MSSKQCVDCKLWKSEEAFRHPSTKKIMASCRSCVSLKGAATKREQMNGEFVAPNVNVHLRDQIAEIAGQEIRKHNSFIGIDDIISKVRARRSDIRVTSIGPAISCAYANAKGVWKHIGRERDRGQFYYFYDPLLHRQPEQELIDEPKQEPTPVVVTPTIPVVENSAFEIVMEAKDGGFVLKHNGKLYVAKELQV